MDTLLAIHSAIRWLLLATALVVILKYAAGWAGKKPFSHSDATLSTTFTRLLDANVTLGVIMFVALGLGEGQWPAYRLWHGLAMILALGLTYATDGWRSRGDGVTRHRRSLMIVGGALVLILLGVTFVGARG